MHMSKQAMFLFFVFFIDGTCLFENLGTGVVAVVETGPYPMGHSGCCAAAYGKIGSAHMQTRLFVNVIV